MKHREPTLHTDRPEVVLEPWGRHHKDGLLAAADDERVTTYMTDQFPFPYTPEDADEWIGLCEAQDPPLSFAVLIDGVVIGGAGSAPRGDVLSGTSEIGWWLTPRYWNRGITTSVVRRYIEYCFADLDLHRVDAGVFEPNAASARVAEKAGMRLEGIAPDGYSKRGQLFDRWQYGLARRDWDGP